MVDSVPDELVVDSRGLNSLEMGGAEEVGGSSSDVTWMEPYDLPLILET